MQRPSFDKQYIQKELDKIASKISTPLTLFIIGGGGLSFYGLKEATKDIDVVVQNQHKLKTLINALKNLNYRPIGTVEIQIAYRKMGVQKILENQDGFRWDIFVKQVCRALTVSNQMRSRATQIYKKDLLEVLLASKEDIFLFKGITEREADLEDMRLLAESGLNWKIIEQECHAQSAASGRLWENALYERLIDLKEKHNIESPIEKSLKRILEEKLIEITLIDAIKQGNNTIKTISQAIKEPQHFVRKSLKKLIQKGRIKVNKSRRPYEFTLNL
jgi:hypothetical protein